MKLFLNYVSCRLLNRHTYRLVKVYDLNVQKLECKICKKKFGINHSVKAVIDWDEDLESAMRLMYPNNCI